MGVMELRRRILSDAPHLATASGSIATFSTPMTAPLKSCRANFLPVQAGSGDPSPTNVRAISGWTGCMIGNYQKNLVDESVFANATGITLDADGYYSGKVSAWVNAFSDGIPLKGKLLSGTRYTVSCTYYFSEIGSYTNTVARLTWSYNDATTGGAINFQPEKTTAFWNSATSSPSKNEVTKISFALVDGRGYNYILHIKNFQFEAGTSATDYAPYSGATIPLDWSSAGTVYGGYVDLVSGEVWGTMGALVLTPNNINYFRWNGTVIYLESQYYNQIGYKYPIDTSVDVCSHMIPVSNSASGEGARFAIGTSGNMAIRDFATSLEDFQSTVQTQYNNGTPITFCLRLATPTLITTLTPTALKTLRGVNNVWSDAGDVSVSYWTH